MTYIASDNLCEVNFFFCIHLVKRNMSYNRMDTQQLFLWAAVAFAVYWVFFRNKAEFYNVETETNYAPSGETPYYAQGPPTFYPEEEQPLVTAAAPEEVPQYAEAFTL